MRSCNLVVHSLAEAVNDGKQRVSAQELQQQQQKQAAEAAAAESAPADDVEDVAAGEQIEPVTEGESVPVPTGEDPAKEGAEVTKASEAALGDPTRGEKEEA
jgi:hypothetical protein